jgi:hypothetical protein
VVACLGFGSPRRDRRPLEVDPTGFDHATEMLPPENPSGWKLRFARHDARHTNNRQRWQNG